MSDVIEVEGIGKVYSKKLKNFGIATTESLLAKGGTRSGREKIARETGIRDKLILRWVNHADLFRINGVQAQFAELLEAAGVDSVPELAQRDARRLHAKMTETNEIKNLVRRLPGPDQILEWIRQAKTLPRKVTH